MDCMKFCSCCLGEVKHFTKRVNSDGLISLLSTKMNTSNTGLSVSDFVKLLKTSKEPIFHNDDIPKNNQMSQVHAVSLQTLGVGIIKLIVTDRTKVGTKKVTSANIALNVGMEEVERNGRLYLTPCYMIDECWNGINVCSFN